MSGARQGTRQRASAPKSQNLDLRHVCMIIVTRSGIAVTMAMQPFDIVAVRQDVMLGSSDGSAGATELQAEPG